MRKSFFAILYFSGFALSTSCFAEPQNLSLVKIEVEQYHDSGAYQKELTAAIEKAHTYILEQAKIHEGKQLAVVLDIDETSISNYDKMVKREFNGDKIRIHQEILAANSPAIEPMLSLYKDTLKHNIKVFFVTGRYESEREATRTNLLRAGYTEWTDLILRPDIYALPSIVPFKSQARKNITDKGYTIIATIGDQISDIKGGYAKKGFKLPNPYYYLP